MKFSIAFCGLKCDTCPAYIAKQTNDQALRIKTAESWSLVGFHVKPTQVNCDGCHSGGTLLTHCNSCLVRKCGEHKGIQHCGQCNDYPCDQLKVLWRKLHAPQAKERLDELRL